MLLNEMQFKEVQRDELKITINGSLHKFPFLTECDASYFSKINQSEMPQIPQSFTCHTRRAR